jgi:hypothetical protein
MAAALDMASGDQGVRRRTHRWTPASTRLDRRGWLQAIEARAQGNMTSGRNALGRAEFRIFRIAAHIGNGAAAKRGPGAATSAPAAQVPWGSSMAAPGRDPHELDRS